MNVSVINWGILDKLLWVKLVFNGINKSQNFVYIKRFSSSESVGLCPSSAASESMFSGA